MHTEIEARDAALAQVLANAGEQWQAKAEKHINTVLDGQMVTGEDMRLSCLKAGIKPHHPNAWGGFVAGLIKREVIEPTGIFRQMKAPGSHARITRVYIVR